MPRAARLRQQLLAPDLGWRAATVACCAAMMFPAVTAAFAASFGSTAQAIRTSLKLTSIELGILGGVFVFAIGVGQLAAGPLIDRFGAARTVALASVVAAIAAVGFATAQSFGMAVVARALVGAAVAFAVPSFGAVAARVMSAQGMAVAMGAMSVSCGVAGFLGVLWGGTACEGDEWRTLPWGVVIMALPTCVAMLWLVRGPRFAGSCVSDHEERTLSKGEPHSIIDLLRVVAVRRACLISMGLGGVFFSFGGYWNAFVARVIWDLPSEQWGPVTACFQFGFAVGAIAVPLAALRFGPIAVLRIATGGAFLLLNAWLMSPVALGPTAASIVVALLGMMLAAMAVNTALAVRSVPLRCAGSCVALVGSVGLLSGFAMQFLPPLTSLIDGTTSLQRAYICGSVIAVIVGASHLATYRQRSTP